MLAHCVECTSSACNNVIRYEYSLASCSISVRTYRSYVCKIFENPQNKEKRGAVHNTKIGGNKDNSIRGWEHSMPLNWRNKKNCSALPKILNIKNKECIPGHQNVPHNQIDVLCVEPPAADGLLLLFPTVTI